jgi:anti-sigma regulatory factor (Ser/Thr protein kinase)
MALSRAVRIDVTDATSVGDVRRRCAELTADGGFDDVAAGRVAIIATEITGNLVRHATAGQHVIVRLIERPGRLALELLGIDAGPGMQNAAHALRDGFSTSTTPGTGLGAVRRLADDFHLHSQPDAGTVVLARVLAAAADPGAGTAAAAGEARARAAPLQVAALVLAKPGQDACGDAWAHVQHGDRDWILVADGLGHGPDAAIASGTAVRAFERAAGSSPAEQLRVLHDALRPTRGAAVAIAEIRRDTGTVIYAGIGNIAGAVVSPGGAANMISHDGIVGHMAAHFREFEYAWPEGAVLVMHSDGLTQRWGLERYPGIIRRDPALIAAVLLRDASRGRDDTAVVVATEAAAG